MLAAGSPRGATEGEATLHNGSQTDLPTGPLRTVVGDHVSPTTERGRDIALLPTPEAAVNQCHPYGPWQDREREAVTPHFKGPPIN
ncbi:uncharacterized protein [Symphalangus syndactylus]|uniref:uncharacterized protein isoform X4 n=1 Tax=Symphalangus syndactylus TaxID=9590 RepID=UPI0024424863|nr:uncharacterized protein LOC129472709 isoform X4 [Symphalangus syndactylus]